MLALKRRIYIIRSIVGIISKQRLDLRNDIFEETPDEISAALFKTV